jgi:hypothetical protein
MHVHRYEIFHYIIFYLCAQYLRHLKSNYISLILLEIICFF